MSMRRPRIKPQVNLASTRRRNTAKQTPNAVDAPKSDTQQHSEDNNENNKPNATQLTGEETIANQENRVQVSVIDYNETSENANSSTTEYMVTIQNDEELTTTSKQHKSKNKPTQAVEEHTMLLENANESQSNRSEEVAAVKENSELVFKTPSQQLESESDVGTNDNIMQIDMQTTADKSLVDFEAAASENLTKHAHFREKGRLMSTSRAVAEAIASPDQGTARSPQREPGFADTNCTMTLQEAQSHFKQTDTDKRLRTNSSCSAYSDSYASQSMQTRTRKGDETKRLRAQTRRAFANGAPDKTVMKMSDLIYYNPPTAPMEIKSLQPAADAKEANKNKTIEPEEEPDDPPSPKAIVPQLKLNAAGELVLDDKSLEIETTAEQQAKKTLANSSLIYVDEYTGMNGFYKRRPRTRDWPPEETIKFYRCLQVIGTDFSCMLQLFPNRTRRDLKLKFKKEERVNAALINKAILNPKKFNVEDLKTQLEQDELERLENEKKWKEFVKKRPKLAKLKDRGRSIAARILKHGDEVYEHESQEIELINSKQSRVNKKLETEGKDDADVTAAANEKKERKKKRPKMKTDENANNENIDVETPKKRRRGRPKIEIKEVNVLPPFEVLKVKSEQIPVATETTNEANGYSPMDTGNESLNELELFSTSLEDELNTMLTNGVESGKQLRNTPDAPKYEEQTEECTLVENPDNIAADEAIFQAVEEELQAMDDMPAEECRSQDEDDDDSVQDALALLSAVEAPEEEEAEPSESDLGEDEIRNILEQIAEGSMALVSTLDPNDPDKVLNEIYIMNKATGELSDTPLNVPDELVQSILEVMT